MKTTHRLLTAAISVVLAAVLFSGKGILVKWLAYPHGASPLVILMLRMGFAFPVYLLVSIAVWKQVRPGSRKWIALSPLLGILGYHVASYLDFEGLRLVSAGLERMILYLFPGYVLLWNVLFFRVRPSRGELWALVLGYAGITLAYHGDVGSASDSRLLGVLLIMLSGVAYSIFLVVGARVMPHIGSTLFTALAMQGAFVGLTCHYLAQRHDLVVLLHQPSEVYAAAIILAVFGTLIPSFLMNYGVSIIGSSKAALLGCIGPLATLICARLLLNETFRPSGWMGVLLVIVAGMALGLLKSRETAPSKGV